MPVETADTGPFDRDQDGVLAAQDCDDAEPNVYPGADESWDGLDNDCDGFVDGDGLFEGSLPLTASGSYAGERYTWTIDCPTRLDRLAGELDFLVACTPIAKDPDEAEVMEILLGNRLEIRPYPADRAVKGQTWSGWTSIEADNSDGGWDTEGEATVEWLDTGRSRLVVELDAVWLSMSGTAQVERVEK